MDGAGADPRARASARWVAVLSAAAWTLACPARTGAAGFAGAVAHPQEMPASVASDLVERALEEDLEAPLAQDEGGVPSGSQAEGPGAGGGLSHLAPWLLAGAATLGLLRLLRVPLDTRRPPASHNPARAPSPEPDGLSISRSQPGSQPRHGRTDAAPTETLAIPPHVLEMLRRSAERRAAEAASRADEDEGRGGDGADTRGIDVVLPRYDPSRDA